MAVLAGSWNPTSPSFRPSRRPRPACAECGGNLTALIKKKKLWGSVLAAILLVWSFYDLDLTEVGLIVQRLRYFWLVLTIPVVVGVLWVRSARWRVLLSPMKVIRGGRMFSIYAVGQLANLLFPAGTGQAVRMLLLHRAEGVTKTGAVSTMMLETLLDGLSLLLFMMGASAALVLPEWLQRGERWISIIVLVAFALFVAAVHYRHRIAAGVNKLEHRLPEAIYARIDRIWTNFSEGLSALRSLKHLTAAFFLSVASWVGNLAVISLLLYAFDITLPTGAPLVLMIINAILMVVPITPGNIGTYQVACVIGLTLFGVPKTDAVSYGLILQLASILPIIAVGTHQYFRHSWTLKESALEAELENLEEVSRDS